MTKRGTSLGVHILEMLPYILCQGAIWQYQSSSSVTVAFFVFSILLYCRKGIVGHAETAPLIPNVQVITKHSLLWSENEGG